MALRQSAQAAGDIRHVGQPHRGIAMRGKGDVLAQKLVVDFCFPAHRQRLAQVADNNLIQHDAEGIDVGLDGGQVPGEAFRGAVDSGTRRALVQHGRTAETHVRDAGFGKTARINQPATAKVGKPNLKRLIRRLANQNIVRLQVLVEHTDGVRRRQRLGRLGHDGNAFAQGRGCQSTARANPFGQGVAAVGAFQKKWRALEIPVEYANEIVRIRDPAEQARKGNFALERPEPVAIQGELVHPKLAGFGVPGQPDLALPPATQEPFEAPQRT